MQQRSSQALVRYWDEVRGQRPAPQRCEIEPARIAPLLPVTFILDCAANAGFRFRLAGTRICEQLGRELRDTDLRGLFDHRDRKALEDLLRSVVAKRSIGVVEFEAACREGREVRFEMVVMPLIHASRSVNRLLGCMTAIDPPYWLGSVIIAHNRITSLRMVAPERLSPPPPAPTFTAGDPVAVASDGRRRFRVFEGGRSR